MLNDWIHAAGSILTVWTTTKAAGLTAYLLLFISMVAGIVQGTPFAKGPKRLLWNLAHQWCGWFGLLFGMLHGIVLVFDQYVGYSLAELAVPFASDHDRLGTGLGILAFYLMAILILSSDLMKKLGKKVWRTIHFVAFPTFVLALVHGLMAGSDSAHPVFIALYAVTGGTVAVMLVWRIWYAKNAKSNGIRAGGLVTRQRG